LGVVTYFVRMIAKDGTAEEVQRLLLENPHRIEQGEPGNLAFGVHRSVDNPNEFWLYETWASEEAVQAHEGGAAFQRYKAALRPLVEPDSVLFGNCVPVKILGYSVEPPWPPGLRRRRRDPPSSG
jgi:quinol monooxygenase YgiN